jgi:hypothetical protein
MAHRKNVLHTDGRRKHIYNVTQSVGEKCANRTDDVMLVQFLVKTFFEDPKNTLEKPADTLPVTGFFGPITLRYLRAFSKACTRRGIVIEKDNRLDPAGALTSGTISKKLYKIVVLCGSYADLLASRGQKQRYRHLDKEPDADVPMPLKAAVGPDPGDGDD